MDETQLRLPQNCKSIDICVFLVTWMQKPDTYMLKADSPRDQEVYMSYIQGHIDV